MIYQPDTTFDDHDEDPDDSAAVDAYAQELQAAVEAFGLTPLETGTPHEEVAS